MHAVEQQLGKRTRSESPDSEDGRAVFLRRLLQDEIDFEIALRKRLLDTVQYRIEWASAMKQCLRESVGQEPSAVDDFHSVALESLDTADSLSNFLSSDIPSPPPSTIREFSRASTVDPVPPAQTRVRHTRHASATNQVKLLFLRDTMTTPPIVYKLECLDCQRSDFTNLQGLVNHIRIKHDRDVPSHDECIQMCATIIPKEDEVWVTEHGTEISGTSASLRRLFEMAVGAGDRVFSSHTLDDQGYDPFATESFAPAKELIAATHLSKTLGHHQDTPELAQFLGRTPKRRVINVYDAEEMIDIGNEASDIPRADSHHWQMNYKPRSTAIWSHENTIQEETAKPPEQLHVYSLDTSIPSSFEDSVDRGTRFHITARLIVADWSMRVSDNNRKSTDELPSHKWMVSVHSPIYTLHVSRYLVKMTVMSVTDPTQIPLVVTDPPYAVMGTTNKPFLARIVMEWSGSQNTPMHVEHWVELNVGRTSRAVLGDEQMIDVELDRNTPLLPYRNDMRTVDWNANMEKKKSRGRKAANFIEEPEHVRLLRSLLPRFPTTMKDIKSRAPYRLPYTLATSPAHFQAMVPGRRKAIELGRARALCDAYHHAASSRMSSDSQLKNLAASDVYHWMKSEGHFPRTQKVASNSAKASSSRKESLKPDNSTGSYCSFCGMESERHISDHKPGSNATHVCDLPHWVTQRPMLDIRLLLRRGVSLRSVDVTIPGQNEMMTTHRIANYRRLLATMEPTLVYAVRDVIGILHLSSFRPLCETDGDIDFTRTVDSDRRIMELAPFALLTSALRAFIPLLISRALATLQSSDLLTVPRFSSFRARPETRLLTPAHVLQGIMGGNNLNMGTDILTLSLSRLGLEKGYEI